jgi:L-methionine (R)-S-oxide reductase
MENLQQKAQLSSERTEALIKQHQALLVGRWLTDLANTSAFIFSEISGLNWVGFYLYDGKQLTLGPFQGLPACTDIVLTKGVCGAAATQRETVTVNDVHQFPGHISCDPQSRSEIVVPMLAAGKLVGVFDVDAPTVGRFGDSEKYLFQKVIENILALSYTQPA